MLVPNFTFFKLNIHSFKASITANPFILIKMQIQPLLLMSFNRNLLRLFRWNSWKQTYRSKTNDFGSKKCTEIYPLSFQHYHLLKQKTCMLIPFLRIVTRGNIYTLRVIISGLTNKKTPPHPHLTLLRKLYLSSPE